MSGRRINALERKLHQSALAKLNKVISQKDLDNLVSDTKARVSATNFLLSTGLFVLLKGDKDTISYRAVSQDEIELKKGLSQEEAMVLDPIRAAATEDTLAIFGAGIWTKHIKLKTQLHKTVVDKCLKSLTQKHLIKSFIKLLSDVCLNIIRDRSLPKLARGPAHQVRLLYPSSYSSYPNAEQILALVKRSRVTETELTIQHIEMLLDVLIVDGKIEKIPVFALFDQGDASENSDSDMSTGGPPATVKGLDDGEPRKQRRRRRDSALATSDDDTINANDRNRRERKKPRRDDTDSDVRDTTDGNASSSEDDEPRRKRRRLDEQRDAHPGAPMIHSAHVLAHSGGPDARVDVGYSSGFIYRAIHEERVVSGLGQAPCMRCPTYDLCKDGGPVSARGCAYYETWLAGDVVPTVEEVP
ncbi:hypothetical protein DAEQUDRAFT_747603 [Daedalea quercina L-15889]|uniref:DNA-directed RNA polymerase III subunit RPC6 n=1 Tax=Daedalea quercina L-15889 TaxID=1314783 RepID=A0A165L8A7_9APHY|nr:hypothetical protein DAEQUDRAFT_747603 [Daedalea quercina L-15889]